MLSFLKEINIVKSNRAIGVHCFMRPEGDMLFHYVLIAKVKGRIIIEKNGALQGELEQLATELPSDIPVYLSLDGKGVLSKKITLELDKSPIHQVIPNASEDEFLVHQTLGIENFAFTSIARRDVVDEVLNRFLHYKFHVIGLTLGPFSTIKIVNIFDYLPSSIWIHNYLISFDKEQGRIIDFKKEAEKEIPEEYTIDEHVLSSDYLVPLYHAISYYMSDDEALKCPVIDVQYDEYASKRLFMFAGWGILVIFFLVLMINMFLFTSYSKESQKLETHVAGNKELLNKLKTLKEELSWKEKFLSQAGILKNTRMSYYADQIALSLPEAITLGKMEIHPITSKIEKKKEIEMQPDLIQIEGMANHSELINEWINKLKQLPWVEGVSVVNYSKDENDAGIFSLEIEINRQRKINNLK